VISPTFFTLAVIGYVCATGLALAYLVQRQDLIHRLGSLATLAGWACHSLALVIRGIELGRPPFASLPEAARSDQRDVVLALRAEDLADLPEQRVDGVADPTLPELPERGEITPDLSRVDVRVVGDLLRGDALLSHFLRLRQHLEVARQTRRHSDRQPIRYSHRAPGFESL